MFLDIVREANENGEEYISIPHVRDVMFPPAKRYVQFVHFLEFRFGRVNVSSRMLYWIVR